MGQEHQASCESLRLYCQPGGPLKVFPDELEKISGFHPKNHPFVTTFDRLHKCWQCFSIASNAPNTVVPAVALT